MLYSKYLAQYVVEAPVAVFRQDIEGLPSGVTLQPGRIAVDFTQPQKALEKLRALALAVGNDFEGFTQRIKI